MKNILTQNLAKYYLPSGNNTSTIYNEKSNISMLNATRTTNKLIRNFFAPINALASKPTVTVTSNSVIVHVFYYIPNKAKALNNNTINNLGETLNSIYGRPVQLRLVKLHYPFLNRYILAQYISLNAHEYKLVHIVNRIFSSVSAVKDTESYKAQRTKLPSHIVGIKVRLAGRLRTERSRPRETVQTAEVGSFSKNNLTLVDNASFTSKNKKGAYTVKVWISQRAII